MPDSRICDELQSDLNKAAKRIMTATDILVVAHIDADGITSAAIATETCRRLGKDYEVLFAKKMDEITIDAINKSKRSLVWIVDLGSGYLSSYTRNNIVVTDHHVPDPKWRRKGQTMLECFTVIEHVNLHKYGMDGSVEGCGATMTYLVSKTINDYNRNLAYLAVVGACGDIQDRVGYRLTGLNEIILQDAVECGDVVVKKDLRLFGRETRPIVQFLQYGNDPPIPGITDNNTGCNRLLAAHSVQLKRDGRLTVWNDLTDEEKAPIIDDILEMVDPKDADAVYGVVYTLPKFPKEGGLRDAKEFATALNSCGRYDDAPTGMRMCFGDTAAVKDAGNNRAEHRRNISAALQFVKQNDLIRVRRYIQYFDAGDSIKETVVGIVTGMMLSTGGIRKDLPMIAFADADDGIKVSARADKSLGEKGLDLSKVMSEASEKVGGYGGGHNIAAGATIPEECKERFLDIVEDMVRAQLT